MNVNVGKTRVGRENVWNTDEKKVENWSYEVNSFR